MAYDLSTSSSSGDSATSRFSRSAFHMTSNVNPFPNIRPRRHSISAPGNLVQLGCDMNSRKSPMPIKPRRVFSIQRDMNEMVTSSNNHSLYPKDDIRSAAVALSSNHHKKRLNATGGKKKASSMVYASSPSDDGSTKVTSFANMSQAVMGNFMTSGNHTTTSPEDIFRQTQANQIRQEMDECIRKILIDNDRESFLKLKAELKRSGMATSAAATRHHIQRL